MRFVAIAFQFQPNGLVYLQCSDNRAHGIVSRSVDWKRRESPKLGSVHIATLQDLTRCTDLRGLKPNMWPIGHAQDDSLVWLDYDDGGLRSVTLICSNQRIWQRP